MFQVITPCSAWTSSFCPERVIVCVQVRACLCVCVFCLFAYILCTCEHLLFPPLITCFCCSGGLVGDSVQPGQLENVELYLNLGLTSTPILLITPAGLKVSQRCSKPDRGSNNEGRAEEVVIIDHPHLLWALGEFVLCPPSAPLHYFLPSEQPGQHFETATLREGHKFSSQTRSLYLSLVWPLGTSGARFESNPYLVESALLQNSLIPWTKVQGDGNGQTERSVGVKACSFFFFLRPGFLKVWIHFGESDDKPYHSQFISHREE